MGPYLIILLSMLCFITGVCFGALIMKKRIYKQHPELAFYEAARNHREYLDAHKSTEEN